MSTALRSPFVAGTAAVLAAGAVAAAPALPTPTALSAASHTASVELAALANPIEAIINSLGLVAYWGFSPENVSPGIIYPANSPIYSAGWLFDLILPHPNLSPPASKPLPVLQQIAANVFGYANTAIGLELDAAQTLVTGLLNAPAGVTTAFLQVLDQDFEGALDTLYTSLIDPVVQAATLAVRGVVEPLTAIVTRGAAAIAATVDLVVNTVRSVIDNTGLVFTALTNTVDELVFNLGAGDFEKAWNTAVGGFLGQFIPYNDGVPCGGVATCRAGAPAQLIRSTIGGLASYPQGAGPTIWSVRWALAEGGQNVARALATPVPSPMAARVAAPAAAEPPAIAPAPAEDTTPVTLSKTDLLEAAPAESAAPVPAAVPDGGSDTPAGGGAGASAADDTPKPVSKQRVSRKAN